MGPGHNKALMQAGRAGSAGYFLILAMLLGSGAGYGVDSWLGTAPWGLLVGFALGMTAGFKELYNIARSTRLNAAPTDPPQGNPP